MQYTLSNRLPEQAISRMANLFENGPVNLYVTDTGKLGLGIRLQGPGDTLFIINYPTPLSDTDEYPQLQVVDSLPCDYRWLFKNSFHVGTKVSVIRDSVTWTCGGCTWNLVLDVGLYFDDRSRKARFWVESVDSIGGLLRYGENLREIVDPVRIREFWSLKADSLTNSKREIGLTP